MRIAMLLLLVLVLAVPAVGLGALGDTVIVPGTRIGKWTLAMTLEDLQKINGPTTAAQVLDPEYRTTNFLFYAWSSLDFGAGVIEPHKVGWFAVGFSYSVIPWRTREGISFQQTRADVLKAYGKPSVVTVPGPGLSNLIYDAVGIDFQVYDTGGNIKEMRIFRPGTAKSIWKVK